MLMSETEVRLPQSVSSAMVENGLWDSFLKILENENNGRGITKK
jgi:hypothetical protein